MGTLRLIPAGGKPAIVRRTVGATNPAAGDCRCELCGTQFIIPQAGQPRVCQGCRDELARAMPDAHEEALLLLRDVNDLSDGVGRYAGLTREERDEQLRALGTLIECRTYNPTKAEDAKLRDSFRKMADQQIIDYIAGAPADSMGYQAFAVMVACEELARRMERRDAAAWSERQAENFQAESDA